MNDLISLEKIAQWQKLKTLVLDSVSSPITKRVYNMALDEFMGWFQQSPRRGFTKATVSAWRVSLEDRRFGSSSITIRMSAIRKLAARRVEKGRSYDSILDLGSCCGCPNRRFRDTVFRTHPRGDEPDQTSLSERSAQIVYSNLQNPASSDFDHPGPPLR